jgi:hypothetical protein
LKKAAIVLDLTRLQAGFYPPLAVHALIGEAALLKSQNSGKTLNSGEQAPALCP